MDLRPQNLLLLRGLAREERHWGEFPQLLKERIPGLNLHFLELPGVGKKANHSAYGSIAEYTNELREEWITLKEKHSGPWGIIAISMGGMIAMDWANRFQEDMKTLILINSSAGNLSPPHHRFSPMAMGMVLKLFFREDYEEREEAILKLTTNLLPINQEIIKKYASYSADSPIKRASFIKQMYAASRFQVPKRLTIPLLLLASKGDRLASYKCSKAISKQLDRKLHLHDKAGHDLPLDDPKWVIDHIQQFFDQYFKNLN